VPRSPPLSYGDRWITENPLGPSSNRSLQNNIPHLTYTPNIQIHPLQNNIHVSKVHCGSAFEAGASGLPYFCAPPVCVPDVIGALAVWWQNIKKSRRVPLWNCLGCPDPILHLHFFPTVRSGAARLLGSSKMRMLAKPRFADPLQALAVRAMVKACHLAHHPPCSCHLRPTTPAESVWGWPAGPHPAYVCWFDLFNWYWGIITPVVLGFPQAREWAKGDAPTMGNHPNSFSPGPLSNKLGCPDPQPLS